MIAVALSNKPTGTGRSQAAVASAATLLSTAFDMIVKGPLAALRRNADMRRADSAMARLDRHTLRDIGRM